MSVKIMNSILPTHNESDNEVKSNFERGVADLAVKIRAQRNEWVVRIIF